MDSSDTGRDVLKRIAELYEHAGHRPHGSRNRETVTPLEHALQCAQLAEWAGADPPLVAAALLHDIGQVMSLADGQAADRGGERARELLAGAFGPDVLEPIRLQAAAQRYLLATEPDYRATLADHAWPPAAPIQALPMSEAEQQRFEDEAFAPQAVVLRRWIDAEKMPGKATPSLDYYLALLEELREQPRAVRRSVVGALDV